MSTHLVREAVQSLDRSIKLTLGIWGCITAPILIWAGTAFLILATLGTDLQLKNPGTFGLQLLFAGIFWELAILFTFGLPEE